MENLHDHRRVYDKSTLVESEVAENPIQQFKIWFLDAENDSGVSEANAMSVSTIEEDGCPRTRMVLLKSFNEEGFVFYTNYDSRKGAAIENHHKVCLHFFWPSLERQIIIKATVERTGEIISDGYFHQRPRGSQLGAIASDQSRIVPSRTYLEERLKKIEMEMEGKEVPRPKNWGGYIAKPFEIEFWQGRPNRLHDRLMYGLQEDLSWKISRLAP